MSGPSEQLPLFDGLRPDLASVKVSGDAVLYRPLKLGHEVWTIVGGEVVDVAHKRDRKSGVLERIHKIDADTIRLTSGELARLAYLVGELEAAADEGRLFTVDPAELDTAMRKLRHYIDGKLAAAEANRTGPRGIVEHARTALENGDDE